MTDCITAEEYKPENVEHTEQDASHKTLSDSSADCCYRNVRRAYVTALTDEIWRHFHRSRLSEIASHHVRQRETHRVCTHVKVVFCQEFVCTVMWKKVGSITYIQEKTQVTFQEINTLLALFEKKLFTQYCT